METASSFLRKTATQPSPFCENASPLVSASRRISNLFQNIDSNILHGGCTFTSVIRREFKQLQSTYIGQKLSDILSILHTKLRPFISTHGVRIASSGKLEQIFQRAACVWIPFDEPFWDACCCTSDCGSSSPTLVALWMQLWYIHTVSNRD